MRIVAKSHAAAICGDLFTGHLRLIEYSADLLSQVAILGENIYQLHLQRGLKVLVLGGSSHSLCRLESSRSALNLSHQPTEQWPGYFPNFISSILHDLFERLAADELSGFDHCGQVMNKIW